MKSNYKRLGNYIQEVNKRDTSKQVTKLLGVSIRKVLMPSIANIIGTDMSTYKIIKKNQFAYGPVTSRNGDKISVALLDEYDKAIVSQAYTVFEVIDKNELLPEYLMMWFRRPEFDRYARFKSHGSAREIFGWEEMCETELPIPSIEKQKEVVKEYHILVDRIDLNTKLIAKLEETAQAIYKQWFVDFEFPDKNGKPYKSNGGAMVESELSDIPKGWEIKKYENVMDFKTGKLNSEDAVINGKYPFFTCSNETYKTNTFSFDTEAVILAGNNASAIYPLKYFVGKFDAYQRTYVIKSKHENLSNYQIYFTIKSELENFKGVSSGTATKFLTMGILNNLKINVANNQIQNKFYNISSGIFKHLQNLNKEHAFLNILKETLLSKISNVDN